MNGEVRKDLWAIGHALMLACGVVGFAVALSLLCASGCANPRAQVAAAADAYAAAMETACDLRDAGVLTPQEIQKVDVLQRVAGEALSAWASYVQAGRPEDGYRAAFWAAMDTLTEFVAAAHGEPPRQGGQALEGSLDLQPRHELRRREDRHGRVAGEVIRVAAHDAVGARVECAEGPDRVLEVRHLAVDGLVDDQLGAGHGRERVAQHEHRLPGRIGSPHLRMT